MTTSWGQPGEHAMFLGETRSREGKSYLTTQLARALRAVTLCPRCEDRHMRPYPEEPGNFCAQPGCECWCNTREGGLEERRRDGYEEGGTWDARQPPRRTVTSYSDEED